MSNVAPCGGDVSPDSLKSREVLISPAQPVKFDPGNAERKVWKMPPAAEFRTGAVYYVVLSLPPGTLLTPHKHLPLRPIRRRNTTTQQHDATTVLAFDPMRDKAASVQIPTTTNLSTKSSPQPATGSPNDTLLG